MDNLLFPLGHQTSTVAANATLTPTIPLNANVALVQASELIFYRTDGTTATTTNSQYLPPQEKKWFTSNLSLLRFLADGLASVVQIDYFQLIAAPISGSVSVTGVVNTREMDCATDSIEVCQGTDPWSVAVTGVVNTRLLDCGTDSIEVCQGTFPWDVAVSGTVDTRLLDCESDSISVCQLDVWDVSVSGVVDIRELDCLTDSVSICHPTGTATNGVQVSTAGAAAVSILAANANRKSALITNISVATVRIGVSGVTTTTGIGRLLPGEIMVLTMPYCPDEELFMIREGAVNGTVLVSEVT